MAQTLLNQAAISGQYGDESTAINFSSNQVSTTIVEGLKFTKTANQTNWVQGPLLYTLTVTNNSGSILSNGVLTDTIDTTLVDFDNSYGVKLDNATYSDFTYQSGLLTITLPSLEDSKEITITFQVTRKS